MRPPSLIYQCVKFASYKKVSWCEKKITYESSTHMCMRHAMIIISHLCTLYVGSKDLTVPFYRIDVPNLLQGRKYHICVYQKGLHFEKCAVFTSNSDGKERERPRYSRDEDNSSDQSSLSNTSSWEDTYEDLEHECVILPSLVSGSDMSAVRLLFHESTPLNSTKYLYFTGD